MKSLLLINRTFTFFEYLKFKSRLNLFKTIYVNLRSLPFSKAMYFPIFIYGKLKIISLNGCIEITDPIEKGMIKIGLSDPLRSLNSTSVIQNDGRIIIGKNVIMRKGISIGTKPNAVIQFGSNVFISDNTTITSHVSVMIGNNTIIGNNSTIMDTDFHYLANIETGEVNDIKKGICIGNNNWIAGWVFIKKGTSTPDYTTIAGPYSVLSKDYTKVSKPYSILGGIPAKLIKENMQVVSNIKSHKLLNEFFKNSNRTYFVQNQEIEAFCKPNNIS